MQGSHVNLKAHVTRRRAAAPRTPPHQRAQQRLANQTLELSMAAPQVMAERLTRMAFSGLNPSQRDHDEFMLMGSEKIQAFQQSWAAMWAQAWQSQVALADSLTRSGLALVSGRPGEAGDLLLHMPGAAAEVLSAGLAPLHGKAVANARRLSRQRK
ncbi:MAG: hypothetical protein I8H88_09230 [Burkholderiales bacterium]|nr:hypothetical protein [Burkholderiales bacterium]